MMDSLNIAICWSVYAIKINSFRVFVLRIGRSEFSRPTFSLSPSEVGRLLLGGRAPFACIRIHASRELGKSFVSK